MFEGLLGIRITQADLRVLSPDRTSGRGQATHEVVEPTRCTWVLERRQGTWVIIRFHESIGVA
jgi:hypothetical protein